MTIVPRGKLVLVRVDDAESAVSEYGISAPDNVEQEQKAFGTVEAVGPDIKDLKKGNRVIYGAYAGEQIEVQEGDGKVQYRLLDDEDVIAFIR